MLTSRERRALLSLLLAALPSLAQPPLGLYSHSAILVRNVLYVYGGEIQSSPNSTVTQNNLYSLDVTLSFSQGSPPWTESVATSIPPLSSFAIFPGPDGESFFIFGGGDSLDRPSPSILYQYNPATHSWSEPTSTGSPPVSRKAMSAVYKPDTADVFVFGGYTDASVGLMGGPFFYNEVYDLNLKNQNFWHNATGSGAPSPRYGHTASLLSNGKMLVIGGMIYLGTNNTKVAELTSISVYDTVALSWAPDILTTGLSPSARFGHSAVITSDQRIIVFGGEDSSGNLLNDVAVLSTSSNTWSAPSVSGDPPPARAYHSATLAGDNMVVAFGFMASGQSSSTQFLSVPNFSWLTTYTPANLPALTNITASSTSSLSTLNTSATRTIISSTASSAAVKLNENTSSVISSVGGVGGIVGISVGSLVIVSVAIFLCFRRPKSRTRVNNSSTLIESSNRQPIDEDEDDDLIQSDPISNNRRAPPTPNRAYSYNSLSPQANSPAGSPAMRAAIVPGQGSIDSYMAQPVRPFAPTNGQTRPNMSTAVIYDRVEDLASPSSPLLSNNSYDMYQSQQSSHPLPTPPLNRQVFSQYESVPNLTMQLLNEEPDDEDITHASTVDSANRRYSGTVYARSQTDGASTIENTSDTYRSPGVTNTGDVQLPEYSERATSERSSMLLETVVRMDGAMMQNPMPPRNSSRENLSLQVIKPEAKRNSF